MNPEWAVAEKSWMSWADFRRIGSSQMLDYRPQDRKYSGDLSLQEATVFCSAWRSMKVAEGEKFSLEMLGDWWETDRLYRDLPKLRSMPILSILLKTRRSARPAGQKYIQNALLMVIMCTFPSKGKG